MSETPPDRARREDLVRTFFREGAALTDEIVQENARLRFRVAELDEENARLRTQLASDAAMRDLLARIEGLEREKQALSGFVARSHGLEEELSTLASVYVASFQLGASLRRDLALRHVGELLTQLVGARAYGVFLLDEKASRLECVSSLGLSPAECRPVVVGGVTEPANAWAAAVERALLTGVTRIEADPFARPGGAPIACVPLRLEERVVGVVAVASLLPQKAAFLPVDQELFKLLGAHAAAAVFAAELYESNGRALPSPRPADHERPR